MRTTIVPAQITTVEDRIVGNLNLTQIILLLTPVIASTAIFALLPQKLVFSFYKIPAIAACFLIFFALALRIKGRVVINWLTLLVSYHLRPGLYVFNKNNTFLREGIVFKKEEKAAAIKAAKQKHTVKADAVSLALLQKLFKNRQNLSFKFTRNGGVNASWQIKN